MADRLIQIQALYTLVDTEPYFLVFSLLIISWFFYKFFLNEVSEERHKSLRDQHQSITKHFVFLTILFLMFWILQSKSVEDWGVITKATPYLGVLTFVWGNLTFVKISRLLVLQYLFLGHMREGVPLLMVNVFSLILSIVLLFWGMSHVFGIQLAPLMATSAAFSIILGLAMQDTLGNLFAGISLQLDKNFEIGDWIEVMNGPQKAVGQVKELSWRSTLLVGLSDELITLPNRVMAQAQISNFSPPEHPILRSQVFRVGFDSPLEKVKEILESSASAIAEIRGIPAPFAYVQETTESWVAFKLIYFIDSYGSQFVIGDKVQRRGIEALHKNGLSTSKAQLEIIYNGRLSESPSHQNS